MTADLAALLTAPALELLGAVLLHSLWQGALVALVAAVALALLRAPAARYRAALLALAALLTGPAATGAWLAGRGLAPSPLPAVAAPAPAGAELGARVAPPAEAAAVAGSDRFEAATAAPGAPAAQTRSATAARPGHALLPVGLEPPRLPLAALALAWLAGVLLLTARLAGGLALVARLRRRSRPAPAVLQARCDALALALGLRGRVALRVAARLGAPAAVGWLRPAVLLPASALTGLPAAQLEAVLAHELAHVRRRDYLANLLQRLAETLLFHHPAAWWLSGVARREREHLCDDLAVRATGGDPRPLARALAGLEHARRAPRPALGANDGPLLARVARLLGARRGPARVAVLPAALPALLLALAALLPVMAQGPEGAGAPPAGTIEGRVVDALADVPRAGARVVLLAASGAPLPLAEATTDAQGGFAFAGLAPGAYRLLAARRVVDGRPQGAVEEVRVELAAGAGRAVEVPLLRELRLLAPGPDATGVATAPTLRWVPLPGADRYEVTLLPADAAAPEAPVLRTARPELEPAELEPSTRYEWLVSAYRDDVRVGGAVGAFTTHAIADGDRVVRIEGRVVDALDGTPVAGVPVFLGAIPDDHPSVVAYEVRTRTDAEGRYAFAGLEPGLYAVGPQLQSGSGSRTLRLLDVRIEPGGTAELEHAQPRPLVLVAPTADAIEVPLALTLRWEPLEEADHYEVRVHPVLGDATHPRPRTLYRGADRIEVDGLMPRTRYSWTVDAFRRGELVAVGTGTFRTGSAAGPADALPLGDPRDAPVVARLGVATGLDPEDGGGTRELRLRPGARPGAVEHRWWPPDGEPRPWTTTPEASHGTFLLDRPGLWTLEVRDEAARYRLPVEIPSLAGLEPPQARLEALGTPDVRLAWAPVPGAAAYGVLVNEADAFAVARLFGTEPALLPADATAFPLAGLGRGRYLVRVLAYSDDPRLDVRAAGLRRVDVAAGAELALEVDAPAALPALPALPAVPARWRDGALEVELPAVAGAASWLLELRRADALPDAAPGRLVHAPAEPGWRAVATAGSLRPGVPYLVEARALPPLPEGAPVNEAAPLAVVAAGPVTAPALAPAVRGATADPGDVRVRLGGYRGPEDAALHLDVTLGEPRPVTLRLLGPDGALLWRRALRGQVGQFTGALPVAATGPLTVEVADGEDRYRQTVVVEAGAGLEPPRDLRLVALGTPAARLAWAPVAGAALYEVRVAPERGPGRILRSEAPELALGWLEPGPHRFVVRALSADPDALATPLRLDVGEALLGPVEIAATAAGEADGAAALGAVEGVVRRGGAPWAGAWVELLPTGRAPLRAGGNPRVRTDAEGRYRFERVPAGLHAAVPIRAAGDDGPVGSAELAVAAGRTARPPALRLAAPLTLRPPPAGGRGVPAAAAELAWEPVPGADRYVVSLHRLRDGGRIAERVARHVTEGTRWQPSGLEPGTGYQWTVEALRGVDGGVEWLAVGRGAFGTGDE